MLDSLIFHSGNNNFFMYQYSHDSIQLFFRSCNFWKAFSVSSPSPKTLYKNWFPRRTGSISHSFLPTSEPNVMKESNDFLSSGRKPLFFLTQCDLSMLYKKISSYSQELLFFFISYLNLYFIFTIVCLTCHTRFKGFWHYCVVDAVYYFAVHHTHILQQKTKKEKLKVSYV